MMKLLPTRLTLRLHLAAVLFTAFVGQAAAQNNLTNGLVAYYPFNGNANDESGGARHGVVNGATLGTNRFGLANSAYVFNGASFVDFPNAPQLGLPNTAFTVSLWVQAAGVGPIFGDYEGTANIGDEIFALHISLDNNPAHSALPNYLSIASRNFPTLGRDDTLYIGDSPLIGSGWHFVAYVMDGVGTCRVTVDGVLKATLPYNPALNYNQAPRLQAGRALFAGQQQFFTGSMDDIRIYNRALSAFEVGQLYASEAHLPGTVVAWGNNAAGQTSVPAGLSGVIAIAADSYHTVALKTDGTVVAWGRNENGQTNVPAGLTGVTAIAAGFDHSVALKADGTVVAWGRNDYGQTNVPAGLTGVIAITAGDDHTVALKNDGTIVGWGSNESGQTAVPAGLNGLVIAISAGDSHTVALKNDGTVVAWGDNYFGRVNVPAGLTGVTAISAAFDHTLALKNDGTVVAWGNNDSGQKNVPVGLTGVVAVAAGFDHSVALKADGTVVAWGRNDNGQTTAPAGLSRVVAIAAGGFHTVALVAPLITSHPQTQTVTVGGNVTLSVTATVTGTAPFSYQWQFNGVNLAGATNSTLTLTNLTFSKAGSYRVVVTDFYGSATSDTARLNFVGLNLYPVLTIADAVGSAYRIEVTSDLVNTNVWTTLTNFTLPSSPFDFMDKSTPQPLRRFYRAVPLP